MKKLAIAIVILVIGVVIYRSTANKPLDPYDSQNARATQRYLATHTNYGRVTIGEWQELSPGRQEVLVSGIYGGIITAVLMLDPEATHKVRSKRIYLLEGWDRPVRDYVKEIDRIMQQPGDSKSLIEAHIKAQIKFTRESGRTQKARDLHAAMQKLPAYIKSDHLVDEPGVKITGYKLWCLGKAHHKEEQITAGILEGIALTDAAMHQGCLTPGLTHGPIKLTSEMRKEAANFKPTDKLINLFEYTAAKYPAQPGTK